MEAIKPSSDLRNRYAELSSMMREGGEPVCITVNGREDTVLVGHAQYSRMKSELEILKILSEAEEDAEQGRIAPVKNSFNDIRKSLRAGAL